jgi:hypothetical protein
LILVLISSINLRAQIPSPYNGMNQFQNDAFYHYHPLSDSNHLQKKWSLNKYAGFSASYGFWNGGSAMMYSVPIGLQLNRQLNNNLYAFASISAAPSYYNFNNSFMNSDIHKYNTGNSFSNNRYGLYSKFEAGLMYINDDKTFSISGSIGIQKGSYPAYPYYHQGNVPKQQPLGNTRK